MRRGKNRELTIFSMSALDLFACALGVFVLISIALFPYFPNTGMSQEKEVDELQEEIEELQRKLGEARKGSKDSTELTQELQKEIADLQDKLKKARKEKRSDARTIEDLLKKIARLQDRLKKSRKAEAQTFQFPHLDLVIALDITGSMSDQISGLSQELDQLTDVLSKLAPSVAIGVVAFGDRLYDRTLTLFDLKEIKHSRSNHASLKRFIQRLRPNIGLGLGSNPDHPEALLTALQAAKQSKWRSRAEKKVIVLITDNPSYPEKERQTIAEAKSFASRGGGRAVSTVYVASHGYELHVELFLKTVAQSGKGQLVKAGGSMTANLLLSLL